MREYCWDSLASLYTVLRYLNPAKLGSGLFGCYAKVSPNSPNFSIRIPTESPKDLGLRSTTELPRRMKIIARNRIFSILQ